MPGGILNKTIVDYWTKTSSSTSDIRDGILGKNLPPPIPFELRETEFASRIDDLGNVTNIAANAGNEYVQFNEEGGISVVGDNERVSQINLNSYFGDIQGDDYYEYLFPSLDQIHTPTLEYEYQQYNANISPQQKGNYNNQRFKLISTGDDIGRRDPYGVLETSDVTTANESFLGIKGKDQLEKSIVRVQGILDVKENQTIPNQYVDGLIGVTSTIKSYRLTEKIGDDTLKIKYINLLNGADTIYGNLPQAAVGWNEYASIGAGSNVLDILGNLGINSATPISTEDRSVQMLLNTSDGQKTILYSNFRNNKYIPDYQDPRIVQLLGDNAPNSRYYIGDSRSTNRGDSLTKTFISQQFNDGEEIKKKTTIDNNDFQWKLDGEEFNDKTLLYKTQELVNNQSDRIFINQTDKFFKDNVKDKYVSRGSAIIDIDNDPTSFFRVWTKDNEYSYRNAIKGMDDSSYRNRYNGRDKAHLSVLQSNNIVKTHPTFIDKLPGGVKKFMLSIENLAWSDNVSELPPCEVGNGDPSTGKRGRIMWFAPYDLQFDENVNVNWTATDFIGRGEPVYTYNNTKRSGQLRFKIVVDHPTVINEFRGRQSNLLEKYFSGGRRTDEVLEDFIGLNVIDLNTEKLIENKLNSIRRQIVAKPDVDSLDLIAFFPEWTVESPQAATTYSSDINGAFEAQLDTLKDILKNSKETIVTLKGYQGIILDDKKNSTVSQGRIDAVKEKIESVTTADGIKVDFKERNFGSKKSNGACEDCDTWEKENSRVEVKIRFNNAELLDKDKRKEKINDEDLQIAANQLLDITIDECNYFDIIDETYPTYFKTISEKIKYFQPGFHSTTPESLNSRITFLHQCTRQGPSMNDKASTHKPQNLAFGKPPVCILRIGDFFNSKIIINSLSYNYAGGGNSPQWDLNPEGIGVQPMIVDVNLSIDIVGGQALIGPINRLQNAVSFNYYANTEMYDKRSDTIVFREGKLETKDAIWPPEQKVKTENKTDTNDDSKTDAETNEKNNSKETGTKFQFSNRELKRAKRNSARFGQ